ncbi:MAG: exonuclease subunit SbcD [Actinomycetota bacterium]|nr:exonuclease subunit SbcD [Actinomycetota bacterium]
MKLLHTSDWHVGKQIRGNSRAAEHRAVLAEMVQVAEREQVDLVVVAGDLWDTAAPTPEAEAIVYDTLLAFAEVAPQVAVVAGNHDNARKLHALAPLFQRARVHVVSEPARPDDGGVRQFTAADGTPVNLALLPFVSQRGIVRSEQLMQGQGFEHALLYAQRLTAVVHMLTASFHAEAANVLVAHAYVAGGTVGGGERAAHLVQEYAIQSTAFPATAGYVALGHLHRAQQLAGASAIHYCGSPLQLDFGEVAQRKQVNVVQLQPGLPAKVTAVPLAAGRELCVHHGTVQQLRESVPDDDAWLRLVVREPRRAGLGDEVRAMFGERAVDVVVEPAAGGAGPVVARRQGRTPHELFHEYLELQGVDDPRLGLLFAQLLDADADADANANVEWVGG